MSMGPHPIREEICIADLQVPTTRFDKIISQGTSEPHWFSWCNSSTDDVLIYQELCPTFYVWLQRVFSADAL